MTKAPQEAPARTRVCLVEYNPLAAAHLRQLLAADPTLRLYCHEELFGNLPPPRKPAPVLVLDRPTLPVALSKYLRSARLRFPDARTILLDNPLPTEELCRLLILGIQGFLPYHEVEANLLAAVHAVASGELWIAPEVLDQYARFAAQLSRTRALKGTPLSRREQHILELVRRRLSNKEIGSILGVSEVTVKYHLGNIFAKLGVRNRSAVVNNAAASPARDWLHQKAR